MLSLKPHCQLIVACFYSYTPLNNKTRHPTLPRSLSSYTTTLCKVSWWLVVGVTPYSPSKYPWCDGPRINFVAGSVNFFLWYLRPPPHPYLCQIECFYHIAAYYGWSEVHSMHWRWMKPPLEAILIRSRSWSVASWLREVVRLCCVWLGTSQRIPTYKTIGDEGSFLFFLPQHQKQNPRYPDFDQLVGLKVSYQHCIRIAIPLPNIA